MGRAGNVADKSLNGGGLDGLYDARLDASSHDETGWQRVEEEMRVEWR